MQKLKVTYGSKVFTVLSEGDGVRYALLERVANQGELASNNNDNDYKSLSEAMQAIVNRVAELSSQTT